MNALLIYPEFPATFWSFKYALKFVSKKANNPPLGLITIASLLPESWNLKLVDMNVSRLTHKDLLWADVLMVSAMSIQRKSVTELLERCQPYRKTIIAGGPLFTEDQDSFPAVDHFILNEAESTLPEFLQDLAHHRAARIYASDEHPDIRECPVPRFDLLEIKKYQTMSLQFSRGCPYDCEFCEITQLFGRTVRLKTPEQIIRELECLRRTHWKGNVFFVDDNFIGNRSVLRRELLPSLRDWMVNNNHPFTFLTEASINLADDPELMNLMTASGFNMVFIGIETLQEESLVECNKRQNKNRDMLESVRRIQQHGLQVTGGFIVGFDHDSPSIFQRQIEFIQNSGIVTAMVGLLHAPPHTKLFDRLKKENRLINYFTGNNTDDSINFIPKMNRDDLVEGYRKILKGIYSCKPYYDRVRYYLKNYKINMPKVRRMNFTKLKALIKSIFILGIYSRGRRQYWKLLAWSLFRTPRKFSLAVTFAIFGYHFRKVYRIRA